MMRHYMSEESEISACNVVQRFHSIGVISFDSIGVIFHSIDVVPFRIVSIRYSAE